MSSSLKNTPAPGTPYFTPKQPYPVGTALEQDANTPTLFSPFKLRSLTFQNRIWVAPMCTYSADNGHLTDFHFAHLSSFAFRGASLTIIEATAVQANGRISPEDSGLWTDSQIAPIARIATFLHSQGQKLGIQLAHAGRKASTVAPWLVPVRGKSEPARAEVGGWPEDVVGPSAIAWDEGWITPRAMSVSDIEETVEAFVASARRAVAAGVDVIEIHAAHGYLLTSFLSPLSNTRTDDYGGSFENRIRIVVDIIRGIRAVIPETAPLLLRVSATEWVDGGWVEEDTARLARLLPALGVDLLDVSSGGNHPAQKVAMHNDYQVGIARRLRSTLRKEGISLAIGAVGLITEAAQARSIVQENGQVNGGSAAKKDDDDAVEIRDEQGEVSRADIVLVARQFLRESEWVLRVAHKLGVKVQWPLQYHRAEFAAGSTI